MEFPVFFPDATKGVIRSLDSADVKNAGVTGLIVNTYHLATQPGASVIKHAGGIKQFMNWDGWIISDSGGFQLLSMIYANTSAGSITDNGVVFRRNTKQGVDQYKFSPEKSIQVQFAISSDIMVCLDDCPPAHAEPEQVEKSVARTILWAKRCKEEFARQLTIRKVDNEHRPLLFGVIQGGNNKKLREHCAHELQQIGFDGYGFGGGPLNEQGEYTNDILQFTASLMPDSLPKYALGVGNPQAIVDCCRMGYTIFDCVLPTRDARHQRLYVFSRDPEKTGLFDTGNVYEYVHIMQEKYTRDKTPVSPYCDCFTCSHYSKAYLHHLFVIEDSLAGRLATIHNLRMYTMLIEKLRTYVRSTDH